MEAHAELLAPLAADEQDKLVDYLQRLLVSQPAELVADSSVEVRAG